MRSRSTRSVIQNWHVTKLHPKIHAHQILDSYLNVGDMLRTRLFYKLGRHSDPKTVGDTLPFQDASTHQIWDSYLK